MTPKRYHAAVVTLHWVMAAAFLLMLASGLGMVHYPMAKSLQFNMYQWHKSLGVLLLIAAGLRLALRLLTAIPPLPDDMPRVEKKAAKVGHLALYLWMLALPLSGWLMVSSSPYGLPTIVFGWFEWPHIGWVIQNEAVNKFSREGHQVLAYLFMALIAGHIAAVIKHAWVERHNLLPRIWFGKR
ncbi:MAG: cytochrome b [Proteobacteria bacterium]|nr:cytochrome b [Pseudomonadota bacterium]